MPGVVQVTKTGPKTFTPTEVVIGGQLVEGRGGSRMGVAAAASTKVLGVALVDGAPPETFTGDPVVANGVTTAMLLAPVTKVAVAYGGIEVPVTYSAPAAFGDSLVCTGAGKVGPAGATPDARTIVGRCTQPEGVAANAVGLMRTV